MKRLLVFFAGVIFACPSAFGQSQCAQTLRLAQSIYEQGRLHELPQILQPCLANGFSSEEKVSAYKLLTLTYIYLEEPLKADESMLALLRLDTEFKVNDAVDPAEFVALYKTFRTHPIYRIGGKLGAVAASPSVISSDFVDDGSNNYSLSFGFTAKVSGEIPLRIPKLTANPEVAFHLIGFNGKNSGADPVRVTEARETQAWISIPLSLQYLVREKGITQFYIAGGISADYLLSSSVRITSSRGENNSPVPENAFDIKAQRRNFNTGAILAIGYKQKIGKGFLVAEARYKLGLLPMLTKSDTYENSTLVYNYKYVDAIFRMNSLSMSVGYVVNRYHPKKLSARR